MSTFVQPDAKPVRVFGAEFVRPEHRQHHGGLARSAAGWFAKKDQAQFISSDPTRELEMTEEHAEHQHTHADGETHVHPHGPGHHDGEEKVEHHAHEHTHPGGETHGHEHGEDHHDDE